MARELLEFDTQEAEEVTGILLVPQVSPLVRGATEDGLILAEVSHQQEENTGIAELEEESDLNVQPVTVRRLSTERHVMVLFLSVLTEVQTEQDGRYVKQVGEDDVEDLRLVVVLLLLEHSHEHGLVQGQYQVTPLEPHERSFLVQFPLGVLALGLGWVDCLHPFHEEHRNEECYVRDEMTLGYQLDALHRFLQPHIC